MQSSLDDYFKYVSQECLHMKSSFDDYFKYV